MVGEIINLDRSQKLGILEGPGGRRYAFEPLTNLRVGDEVIFEDTFSKDRRVAKNVRRLSKVVGTNW
jgi:hypothetical protein